MGKRSSDKGGNQENVRKANRQRVQKRKEDKHESRSRQGTEAIMSDRAIQAEDYNLDWFKPSEGQKEIVFSMITDDLTIVAASSGCGKSTTTIWQGLKELKKRSFKKILFIKTANEAGDDPIGFLSGDSDQKLTAHLEASRGIFMQFMTEAKLQMEEKRGNIEFKIPNFIQGSTYDNTLFIIDEAQNMSPKTLKLVMERVGVDSKIVVLGDKRQCYSSKRREDGFTFFVNMVTQEDEEGRYSDVDTIGYVEMSAEDNMRSELSKLIVKLFEED
jgi:predicted ribonuclease YlaK